MATITGSISINSSTGAVSYGGCGSAQTVSHSVGKNYSSWSYSNTNGTANFRDDGNKDWAYSVSIDGQEYPIKSRVDYYPNYARVYYTWGFAGGDIHFEAGLYYESELIRIRRTAQENHGCRWWVANEASTDNGFIFEQRSITGHYLYNIVWQQRITYGGKNYYLTAGQGTGSATYTEIEIGIFEKDNANYKIYSGKTVGSDFLNSYEVWECIGDTKISILKTSLELAKMSNKVLKESDSTFDFEYNVSDVSSYISSVSCSISGNRLIKLASGTSKYANLGFKTEYQLDEWVTNDLSNVSGGLTYADGTTLPIGNVSYSSLVIQMASDGSTYSLPYKINIASPVNFVVAFTLTNTYLGTLSFSYNCSVVEASRVVSVALLNSKSNFLPSDVIDFGDNAVIACYNEQGEVVKSIARAQFRDYVTANEIYGQPASNHLADGTIVIWSNVYGLPLRHNMSFTYDETVLEIDASQVSEHQILTDEDTDFDYTGLVAKKVNHLNAVNTDPVITKTDITSSCTIYHKDAIDRTKYKTYNIIVSYTNTYGQTLQGTFVIGAEPLRVLRLDITNKRNIDYYDNDLTVFSEPTTDDIKIVVVYNDESHNVEIEDFTGLRFFRHKVAGELQDEIVKQGGSYTYIIKKADGNNIYIYSPTYAVDGYYTIRFVVDSITAVNLTSAVNAYFGNSLRKLKPQVSLSCTRSSGNTLVITDPSTYEFVNTNVLFEEPDTIEVAIVGYGTYEIENADTYITWNNPTPSIVLNTQGFQTVYNNKVDTIYPDKFNVTINYLDDNDEPVEYVQQCAYSSTTASTYDKFNVAGSGVLADYNFGVDVIDVDMQSATEISATMIVSALNRFTDTVITKNLTVKIVELLNITGLKLLSTTSNYYIGEEFLNDDDETQIMIFYKDSDNTDKTYVCKLNVGLTALNIYPVKGTKLNQIATNRTVTVTCATNYNIKVEYPINVISRSVSSISRTHNLVALYIEDYVCPDDVARSKYFLVERKVIREGGEEVDATEINSAGIRVLASGVSVSELSVLGYLDNLGDTAMSSKVILFKDYEPPIRGSNNITVKFPVYVEGNADLINKCHFGIMFGNNNAKNRLFVSGNPDFINKDWHSGEVDSNYVNDETMIDGNYGYFEDLSECSYGETDNAVIGYDIVSNDKLLVLKSYSDKETTVYFRTPQLVTAINSGGTAVTGLDDETLYQEEFSLIKGNNSVAGVSPKGIANFNGDTVFISNEKQIVGLDLTGIVGDNQRYANSRSYYIDEDLRHESLDNAFLWTDNSYLMLVLDNKIYATHFETFNSDAKQYEWYVLDNAKVSSILKLDKYIYYGTNDGKIYRFTDNRFSDADKVFAGYGIVKISVNEETELIIATGYLDDLDLRNTYYFRPIPVAGGDLSYIYYSVGTVQNNTTADCDFYIDNSDDRNVLQLVAKRNGETDNEAKELILKRVSDNIPVFLNKINNSESAIACKSGSVFEQAYGKKYFLREYTNLEEDFDTETILYRLYDENGNVMPVKELYRARICMRLEDEVQMTEINKETGSFKLIKDGKILDIVQYSSQSLITSFAGQIIKYSNVEAYYITKPYTFGSLEYFKTLWSFTLTNDTNIPSEVELCYVSNKVPFEKMKSLAHISKEALGFDMDKFVFEKIDFDKRVAPRTYTNKRILSGVKFVCFGIRNYNDTNAVLSSMSMTYTLPYPSYSGD